MKNLVSVIIPVYNEEQEVANCLQSIRKQSYKNLEIIIVDDGSTDKTLQIVKKFKAKILTQKHKGPGTARNLGASKARGEILVFIDADMTLDKNFIKDLISPICKKKTVGTFSRNEMNGNKDNIWSKYWNINRGWPIERLIPIDYPDTSPVFRAILKNEFQKVKGFDATGEYTDDWSLSRKLKKQAKAAKGAIYYHKNPSSMKEVWQQARWIGKNEFISGKLKRKIRSLIYYSPFFSIVIGSYKSFFKCKFDLKFLLFKILYDVAVWFSVFKSFFGEAKYK